MNYFNGLTVQDFEKYFIDELETKLHFVQYDDPDDFFDPEQEYGKHITESLQKLKSYIKEQIKASGIEDETKIKLLSEELDSQLNIDSKIDDYISRVTVDYK